MAEFMAWKASPGRIFGEGGPELERFRKPWPKDAPTDLVETSYFGFTIPEANLNCEIYHWFHPILGVASGGIFVFDEMHNDTIGPRYQNYQNFQKLPDDITDVTYASGVKIKMIDNGDAFHITYHDDKEDVAVDFISRAIMPAAYRASGGHLTQAMHNTGTFRIRGQDYVIDSFFSRDRSWGDPRSEARLDIPPIGWHVGVFSKDFAFHTTAFDSDDRNPELAKRYPMIAAPKNHIWGYVRKDGETRGLVATRKRTWRSAGNPMPDRIEMEIEDESGERFEIEGVVKSRFLFHPWPNTAAVFSLTEWRCNGLVGYGDTQECLYEDYVRETRKVDASIKAITHPA